jgi:hypothetical protein
MKACPKLKGQTPCGYCKRAPGHSARCPRRQKAVRGKKAHRSPATSVASTNGAGPYASAITKLEIQAGELEGKAKQARALAEQLRALG